LTQEQQRLNVSWNDYAGSLSQGYGARRLFIAETGYLGVAAHSLRVGGQVWVFWVLAGATVPMILRHRERSSYQLVGEAYVYSIMEGEAMADGGCELETIILI
jgi:hypothetical protein